MNFMFTASIVGGIIMGAGFIMGGFCPGTGLSAMSIGKIDAMFYVLGGLTGAFLFGETYPLIQNLANGSYKGALKIDEALGIPTGLFIFLLILAAAVMFWIGELAEKKFARPDITNQSIKTQKMNPREKLSAILLSLGLILALAASFFKQVIQYKSS